MIASIVTCARTLLMGVKFLVMWCNFVGRGMNEKWDQVKRREALELEEFSWLGLPADMVELISRKLRFEDEAKLACVCKRWRDIIQTFPTVYPVGKSPLLIHVKTRGEEGGWAPVFHYYSPQFDKTFQRAFPLDLRGCEIISAKDGTLLIYNRDKIRMKMVDPLSGYSIDLPGITSNISFNGTAVGEYDGCYVIFLIDTSHENQVTMHLYLKSHWVLDLVYGNGNLSFHMSSNPVYCDGRFYCLSTKGDILGVFDFVERTWYLYRVEFRNKNDEDIHCCCYYLVDWIDTVMVVQVRNNGSRIHFFVLNRETMGWKETDDLCGRNLFLGSTLSVVYLPTAKMLQNRVFLPHVHQDEPKTVIMAELEFSSDLLYFISRSSVTNRNKIHATTAVCCCNNSGEKSEYLGSNQNQKYCTIWYLPFDEALNDGLREEMQA